MKTLRHLTNTAFVVSFALLASCSSDNDIEVNNENNNNNANVPAEKLRFSATVEPNVVSRATLNQDDNTLHWDANDKIAVFSPKANKIEEFTVESQYAGQTVAYFSSDKPSTLTPPDETGSFRYYYAFYPAEAVKGLATASSGEYNRAQGYIPTEQKVTEGYTYDKSAMLMIARTTAAEKAFSFLNVNALVKVTITDNDDGKVKYIKLVANNSKIMSGTGTFYFNGSTGDVNQSLVSGSDTKNYVQLEIPASSGSVDYYLSVHNNTFDNGFTLLLESEFDETTQSQSIYQRVKTGSTPLARSTIYDFGDYKVSKLKFLNNVVDLGLASGTIWSTRNVTGNGSSATLVDGYYDYGSYYAWGETEQKANYTEDTYKWYTKKTSLFSTSYEVNKYDANNGYLEKADDVAWQISGNKYRMPTKAQVEELAALTKNYYHSASNTFNGYRGVKFTGAYGRYLWLPAAGYQINSFVQQGAQGIGTTNHYWSRTIFNDDHKSAVTLDYYNGAVDHHNLGGGTAADGRDRRITGKSIRPVVYNPTRP